MKSVFGTIRTTYLALLGGQLIFAFIVYYLVSKGGLPNDNVNYPFGWVTPLLMAGGIGVSFFINAQRKRQAAGYGFSLSRKLFHYRTSVFLRAAILEGINLFPILAALVDNNFSYLLYFGLGLAVFIYWRPSVSEFSSIYDLEASERAQLR